MKSIDDVKAEIIEVQLSVSHLNRRDEDHKKDLNKARREVRFLRRVLTLLEAANPDVHFLKDQLNGINKETLAAESAARAEAEYKGFDEKSRKKVFNEYMRGSGKSRRSYQVRVIEYLLSSELASKF